MKPLKFMLTSILGLALCTACGGDGDDTPGPGKPEGPDKSSTTGIDRFGAANIFSRNTYLPNNTAMQGFNLDSDGSVWYTQLSSTNQAQLNWVRAQPNKGTGVQTENKDYMKLTYFGHGTNTALEEDGTDRYLWAGAYGVCNAKGQYWNEKLVGRVKYVKGATVKTSECNDYYYIGDYTDLHPSIDAENDLLTINYGDSKNSSYRCFVVYKLSEAKKAPMTNVTITCTDGFQTDRPASTNPVSVVVRCHDLTTLTPVPQDGIRRERRHLLRLAGLRRPQKPALLHRGAVELQPLRVVLLGQLVRLRHGVRLRGQHRRGADAGGRRVGQG